MSGSDDQTARIAAGVLFADPLDIFRFAQDALGDFDDALARLGNRRQPLATALENNDAQFIFQQLDLLGNPWLRGIENIRRLGDIQPVVRHFNKITELL